MPFNLQVQSTAGQSMIQGANAVAEALARWREERKKDEFLKAQAATLAQETDLDGKPYIPQEALAKYLGERNSDKLAGALTLPVARYMSDLKTKEHMRQQQRDTLDLSPEEIARAQQAGVVPLRQSRGSYQYVPAILPGTPQYDEEGNQVGVYGPGGRVTKVTPKKEMSPVEMQMAKDSAADLASTEAEMKRISGEMAKGEKRYGPDWNPLAETYPDQLAKLQAKRAGLMASTPGGAAAATAPAATTTTVSTSKYPLGSRARKGDKWYVMTAQGWQPE